jgi:hypothetical protein
MPVDQQVEVDLLGAFLPRPLRRKMLGNLLEGNLLPITARSVIQPSTFRTVCQPVSSA